MNGEDLGKKFSEAVVVAGMAVGFVLLGSEIVFADEQGKDTAASDMQPGLIPLPPVGWSEAEPTGTGTTTAVTDTPRGRLIPLPPPAETTLPDPKRQPISVPATKLIPLPPSEKQPQPEPPAPQTPAVPAPTRPEDIPPPPPAQVPPAPAAPPPEQPPAPTPEPEPGNGLPEVSKIVTQDVVARMLPGASNETLDQLYPLLLKALAERNVADKDMVLYSFATINAETSSGKPIPEIRGQHARYAPYFGRGYIQLTWKDNYKAAGNALGLDLVNNPDLALEPTNAARIFAWFLTSDGREKRLRTAFATNDLIAARKVVNGGTNGSKNFEASWNAGFNLISA